METTLSHEVKVGIFAVAGLVLFCISVILLGGDKLFLTRTYALKVRMPQVQGLGKGSVVSLVGVPVGNVDKIQFVEGSADVEIVVSVERTVQARITEGSKASVKTQGALGDKYIYIEPGPVGSPALKDGAILDIDHTPDLLDVIASKGSQMSEVLDIIKEVHILVANMNRDNRSARLMANLAESSGQLTSTLNEARETFKLLRTEAIVPMASVMKKIDRGQGTLGALINDPSIYNRVSGMLGEAPRNKFLKPLIRESIQTNEQKH